MKKILCPINFTETAFNALEYACNLAQLHATELTLLHVITDEEYNEMLEDEEENIRLHIEKEESQLKRRLESICLESRNSYPGIKCEFSIGAGGLTDNVIDFAKNGRYGLIIMGNDGVINMTEAIQGSSTIKVIERAPCAVLSVPQQANYQGFQKIVFGTEFLKVDREALIQLHLLFKPADSSIHVIHIKKPGGQKPSAAIQKNIDELHTYLNYPKIHFKVLDYEGSVRLGLHEYMLELDADLMVLVTHQRNFLERIFQKSVSKRISYFADYPMLIFLEENL